MIILKKYLKIAIILIILIIFYLYIANITLIPKSITLLQGEKLELATLWGVNFKQVKTSNPNMSEYNEGTILETSGELEDTGITETRKN